MNRKVIVSIFVILSVVVAISFIKCGTKNNDKTSAMDTITEASPHGMSGIIRTEELPSTHTDAVRTNASDTLFVGKEFISSSQTQLYDAQTFIMKFNNLGMIEVPNEMNIQYRLLDANSNKALYLFKNNDKFSYLALELRDGNNTLYEFLSLDNVNTYKTINDINWDNTEFCGISIASHLITKGDWGVFKKNNGIWISEANNGGVYHALKIGRDTGNIKKITGNNKDELYTELDNKSFDKVDIKKSYIYNTKDKSYLMLYKNENGLPKYIAYEYMQVGKNVAMDKVEMKKYRPNTRLNADRGSLSYSRNAIVDDTGGGTTGGGTTGGGTTGGNNNNSGGNDNNSGGNNNNSGGNNNNSGGNDNNSGGNDNNSGGNNNNSGGNNNNSGGNDNNNSGGNDNNSGGNDNNNSGGNDNNSGGNNNNSGGNNNNSGGNDNNNSAGKDNNNSGGNNNNSGGNDNNSGGKDNNNSGGNNNNSGGNDNNSGGNNNNSGGKDNNSGGNDNNSGGNNNNSGGKDNNSGGNDNNSGGNDNNSGGKDNNSGGNNNNSGGNDNNSGGNNNNSGGKDNNDSGKNTNKKK